MCLLVCYGAMQMKNVFRRWKYVPAQEQKRWKRAGWQVETVVINEGRNYGVPALMIPSGIIGVGFIMSWEIYFHLTHSHEAHHRPTATLYILFRLTSYVPVCAAFRIKLLVDRKLFSPTDIAFFTHFSCARALFRRISYKKKQKKNRKWNERRKKWAREMKAILNKFKNVSL